MTNEHVLLSIKNLRAGIRNMDILQGINLDIYPGEVHVIIGPKGSGKTTLSQILAGNDLFSIKEGEVKLLGKNLLTESAETRACSGLFVGVESPPEIPGIDNFQFLKMALNSSRRFQGLSELTDSEFLGFAKLKMKLLDLEPRYLEQGLNHGSSSYEKRRNEIFQMTLLEPKLAIIDENGSDLDVETLKVIAAAIKYFRDEQHSVLLITRNQDLINEINPNKVHLLVEGKIVKTGGVNLAKSINVNSSSWLEKDISNVSDSKTVVL